MDRDKIWELQDCAQPPGGHYVRSCTRAQPTPRQGQEPTFHTETHSLDSVAFQTLQVSSCHVVTGTGSLRRLVEHLSIGADSLKGMMLDYNPFAEEPAQNNGSMSVPATCRMSAPRINLARCMKLGLRTILKGSSFSWGAATAWGSPTSPVLDRPAPSAHFRTTAGPAPWLWFQCRQPWVETRGYKSECP